MYKFRRVQDDIFERIENCTEEPMAVTVGLRDVGMSVFHPVVSALCNTQTVLA